MIALAGLLERLRYCPTAAHRQRVLAECGDATVRGVLAGTIKARKVGLPMLRALAAARVDPVLFAASQDFLGDFVETLALIWPARAGNAAAPALAEVLAEMAAAPAAEVPHLVAGWLDASDAATRLALLRLITGKLRPMTATAVSAGGSAGKITAMLMYAQSVRVGLERDYSFGVLDAAGSLVPVARVMVAERDALEAWVRAHTVAKFGPVREVAPGLLVRLAFAGVMVSPRHKAGLALREASCEAVLEAGEVGKLADLSALLD